MLCERCHKEEAVIHFNGMDANGNVHVMNLCQACAMQELALQVMNSGIFREAIKNDMTGESKDLLQFLAGMVHQSQDPAFEDNDTRCESCGKSIVEVRDGYRLGCLKCLETFEEHISTWLALPYEKAFWGQKRWPSLTKRDEAEPAGGESPAIGLLMQRMKAAVAAEEYELASALKAEIEDLARRLEPPVSKVRQKSWGTISVHDDFALPEQTVRNLPWLPKTETGTPQIRIASYITFLRNLADFPLPPFREKIQKGEEVCNALLPFLKKDPLFRQGNYYDPHLLEQDDQIALVERAYCPFEYLFLQHATQILVSPNERAQGLLNHTDHLQVRLWGGCDDLPVMLQQIAQFSRRLENSFSLMRHPRFGYMERNISALGSGVLQGQVFHLPALLELDEWEQVYRGCAELNAFMRGFFPRKTRRNCAFFILQVPNGFGKPEEQAEALLEVGRIVTNHELKARERLVSNHQSRVRFIDKAFRAVSSIRGMRLISFDEVDALLSTLWLAKDLGMLPELPLGKIFQKITELIYLPQVKGEHQLSEKVLFELQMEIARSLQRDLLNISEAPL